MQTKLEFVFSAFPHYMKMCRQQGPVYVRTAESVQTTINHMRTKLKDNVKVSALFNAFTEGDCAKNASERFTGLHSIIGENLYADSGGLQIVTLGETVDEVKRKKIYHTQMQYATHAMSFDDIPSLIIDKKRYYMPDKVYSAGVTTGENLKEQFEYFKEYNSTVKICPIIQGWGKSDTSKFIDGVMSKASDIWDNFDMVAAGFASGNIWGTAQRAMDIYTDPRVTKQFCNHFHLLGMSGYKRILPIIMMLKSGLIKDMKTLSFDSSSLSMTYVMANVVKSTNDIKNKKKYDFGKKRTPAIEEYYKELFEFWKDAPNFVYKDWNDLLESSQWNSRGIKSAKARHDECNDIDEAIKYLTQEQYYIFYNVYKYAMVIEDFLEGNIGLEHIFKDKDYELFSKLEKIVDIDEFYEWQNYVDQTQNNKIEILTEAQNNPMDSLF